MNHLHHLTLRCKRNKTKLSEELKNEFKKVSEKKNGVEDFFTEIARVLEVYEHHRSNANELAQGFVERVC